MRETSKSYQMRAERGDFRLYLNGHGIDIGCGDDPLDILGGTVDQWDKAQGDAQYLKGLESEIHDFVYSSHCLEHMESVPTALRNWVRILKPGGWLYVVVPDYTLYERLTWPSKWNQDHKHSFSLSISQKDVCRNNHWSANRLGMLVKAIGCSLEGMRLEADGYDWNIGGKVDQTLGNALAQICFVARKLPQQGSCDAE